MAAISTVVVGTDFSVESEVAIAHGMAVSRIFGASMHLVHALSVPAGDDNYPVAIPEGYRQQLQGYRDDAARKLEEQKEWVIGERMRVTSTLIDDMPGRGIPDYADSVKAGLIVTGSHGRTGLRRFLLGSVAERIVRHASQDVLVARNRPGRTGYNRILVPTDFSEYGEAAVSRAVQMASEGGTVDILHCWRLPAGATFGHGRETAGLRSQIEVAVNDEGLACKARHQKDGVQIEFASLEADARYGIESRVETCEYDLVVIGSHGHTGPKRLVLGSVAESVVRHVGLPVYVARK